MSSEPLIIIKETIEERITRLEDHVQHYNYWFKFQLFLFGLILPIWVVEVYKFGFHLGRSL
jgi:hypothetical protein